MHRRLTIITLLLIMMSTCTMVFSAGDEQGLIVYNSKIVTNDLYSTYVEGQVSKSIGQEIVLKQGMKTIAKKVMPKTGAAEPFRIKIPSSRLDKDDTTYFRILQEGGTSDNQQKPIRIKISYKQKAAQEISVNSEEYKLTYPGVRKPVKAEASSGETLNIKTSDPGVAVIDENGNLVPTGKGTAQLVFTAEGNGKYNDAEKTVNITVEEGKGSLITFHSSIDGQPDQPVDQLVSTGSKEELMPNAFSNEGHEFLGWATEDGGVYRYADADSVGTLANESKTTDLYAIWSGDGANAAVAWAIKIANDNSFAYGKRPGTSKPGCYFCGTNQRNKPNGYEKTYVCMTFVTAAYAHGAEAPEMVDICKGGKYCLSTENTNFDYKCWEKVGLTKNLSVSDLKPGDVICSYAADNQSGHLSMYAGDGDIVDAAHEGWGAGTIALRHGVASSYLRAASRHSGKSYVMRYVEP